MKITGTPDPHGEQPIAVAGPPVERADGVLILIHGRGATAQSILNLHAELNLPTLAALAPQAAGHSWYPQSFLAPIQANQPFLDSALNRIETFIVDLLGRKIASDRIALLGFSQGACLASEFVVRHPRKYGAAILFTGGLIGPPGTDRNYPGGSLQHMPVFLGAGDPDPHVPFARVEETAEIFRRRGAEVDLRRYPGMPHTINAEELFAARSILQRIVQRRREPQP